MGWCGGIRNVEWGTECGRCVLGVLRMANGGKEKGGKERGEGVKMRDVTMLFLA